MKCLYAFLLSLLISFAHAQWVPTNGPYIDIVTSVAQKDSTVYATVLGGGVIVSYNNGTSWAFSKNMPWTPQWQGDVAYRSTTGVAVIDSEVHVSAGDKAMYVSYDRANTWGRTNDLLPNTSCNDVFTRDSFLFALTNNGPYYTRNRGGQWLLYPIAFNNQSIVFKDTLVFAGKNGVYWSTDRGATFQPRYNLMGSYNVSSMAANDSLIFASTAGGLFVSNSNGMWWNDISVGLAEPNCRFMVLKGDTLYMASLGNVYRMVIGAGTWQTVNTGLPPNSISYFGEAGGYLYIGTINGCVYRFDNNTDTWHMLVDVSATSDLQRDNVISIDKRGGRILAGTQGGSVYFSNNNGVSWKNVTPYTAKAGFGYRTLKVNVNANALYASFYYDGAFVSYNDGNSWQKINTPGTSTNSSFFITTTDSNITVAAGQGLNSRRFNDTSWTYFNYGNYTNDIVRDGNAMYFAPTGQIYSSFDYGTTWNPQVPTNYFLTYGTLRDIYVKDTVIFAATNKGVRFKLPSDTAFTAMAVNGLPLQSFQERRVLNVAAVDSFVVIRSETQGIMYNTLYGNTWAPLKAGLPYGDANVLEVGDTTFLAGAAGVYMRNGRALTKRNYTGRVYVDVNSNNQFDSTDYPIQGVFARMVQGGDEAITDNFGLYTLNGEINNTDSIAISGIVYANGITVRAMNMMDSIYDFPLNFSINVYDLNVSLQAPLARPGFYTPYFVTTSNVGMMPQNIVTSLTLDTLLTATYTEPMADSVAGNTLFWRWNNATPQTYRTYRVHVYAAQSLTLGDTLLAIATANPISIDSTPINNIDSVDIPVLGSYDPNDKNVTILNGLYADSLENTELVYVVNFQNTGNMQADFVRIRDDINPNLDIHSLKLIASSHSCVYDLVDDRTVEFYFPNINLPDSFSNEVESHGFVKFSIRPVSTLQPGDSITNTASIFFDYNEAIITNTTTSTVRCIPLVSSGAASICNGSIYDFMGTQLSAAGTYSKTVSISPYCDSLVYLSLAVLPTSVGTVSANVCQGNVYAYNNSIYGPGIYDVYLNNMYGCDSIVQLSIGELNSSYYSFQANICSGDTLRYENQNYTEPGAYNVVAVNAQGCDSIITLNLTVSDAVHYSYTETIAQGGSYTFNGNILTQAGTYTDTLQSATGCDSVVTLLLEVATGINEISGNLDVRIFPNPTTGICTIQVSEALSPSQLCINTLDGKVLKIVPIQGANTKIDLSEFASGVYIGTVVKDGFEIRHKFVKQ